MSQLSTLPPVTSAAETPHWTARHGKPIIFVILTMVAVGVYLALTIPVAVFPSTDFPRIVVAADAGVYPIDQMLVMVTNPLEQAVNTVPGLDHLSSITSRGTAEIDLFFTWNVDMFQTLELVNAALARVQQTLPANAKITAKRLTFAAFPIMGYSLTSDKISQTTLWEVANYDLKPRMNRATGVSSVVVQGGQVPEFKVQPDPAKLIEAGVTIPNILDAVSRSNMIDSPGLIETNHQLALTLMSGQARNVGDIGNIIIKTTPAGTPLHINDVATVTDSVMPVYTVVTANGKPAVLLNVYRQPNSKTVQVANAVHAEIESLKKDLPRGIVLTPFYDQSELVNASIKSVRDAILLGLVLASIILVLFLRDWGTSLVAGLVIPVTILVTFAALKLTGQSFNLMTLGGLAAAVGLVIDDAIVVLENIVLHRDAGQGRFQAIGSALRELTIPLIGSTITPIVVFLPLISITGVTGSFFRALAVTMTVSLFTSLLLALTWTPTLSQYSVRRKDAPNAPSGAQEGDDVASLLAAEEAHLSGFFGRIVNLYGRVMESVLPRPLVLVISAVVIVALSAVCYKFLGSDLLPEMDEGGFTLDYFTPPGSSLAESNAILQRIEAIIRATPEAENTSRGTGLELAVAAVTEANRGDFPL